VLLNNQLNSIKKSKETKLKNTRPVLFGIKQKIQGHREPLRYQRATVIQVALCGPPFFLCGSLWAKLFFELGAIQIHSVDLLFSPWLSVG